MRRTGRALRWLTVIATLLLAPACLGPSPRAEVTVLGPWTGEEQREFQTVLDAFTKETGVRTVYQGTRAVDQVLQVDLSRGRPPDVVVMPSAGALRGYARQGLMPLGAGAAGPAAPAGPPGRYGAIWQQVTRVDGRQYAVVVKAQLKSLLWYDPRALRGFRPPIVDARTGPADWGRLNALARTIAARGGSPWCMGVGSTSESGWPGTDWVEDFVLHEFGVDVYQRWANGTLPWTDPRIRRAWRHWAALLPEVRGGATAVLFTDAGDTGQLLYTSPPTCYLQHAAFVGSYRTLRGAPAPKFGFDFVPFPAQGTPGSDASLVSADLAGMFHGTPGARKLIGFLASDVGQAVWPSLPGSGAFSPNQNLTPSRYPQVYADSVRSVIQETLLSSETLCFDASDLMPTELSTAFNRAVLMVLGDPDTYLATPSGVDPLLAELDDVSRRAYGKTPSTFRCGK
jgi:alpha-glucoside transport system substrate-binding protein